MAPSYPNTAAPPMSPAITAQQIPPTPAPGSPMAAFAQNMAGQQDPQAMQAFSSTEYIGTQLDQIATVLSQVANVLSQSRPDLIPLVQKMAQIGSVLTSAVAGGQGSLATGGPEPGVDAGMDASQEGSQSMTLG